ncbi:MAG: hypothetical protein WBO29_02905 [Albidovulum sp.]
MNSKRRWMTWVLAESAHPGITFPWQRGTRQIARRTQLVLSAAE